jgi:hypothetical protein
VLSTDIVMVWWINIECGELNLDLKLLGYHRLDDPPHHHVVSIPDRPEMNDDEAVRANS